MPIRELQGSPDDTRLHIGKLDVHLDAHGCGAISIDGKKICCESFRVSCYHGQRPTVSIVLDTEPNRYPGK
jgi:hypothetical protein